jgi:pSer/pThr/pTyr-binding forkhead associated (FHA) protein
VPLASLESAPEVATIVVPAAGPSTIRRLTASVVVRLNQTPIGIGQKALADGVEIEFSGFRLTFTGDAGATSVPSSPGDGAGEASVTPASPDDEPARDRSLPHALVPPEEFTTPARPARIVNVRTGHSIDLNGCRVVMGRDEACDFVLPGMGVSRRHCSVTPVRDGYLLRDESANGTRVNGSRISGSYLLGHGDVMCLADEELRFEVEGSPAPSANTTARPTEILDVSRLRAEHAPAQTSEWPGPSIVASLEIVRGPYSGASFSINRPVCSIGHAPDSDVRIRDDSLSASHATLLRKGNAWFVVDLRSANGTLVDGLRIAGERELASGSRLKLGRVELMFRASDGGGAAPSAKRRGRWRLMEWLRPLFPRSSQAVVEEV